MYGTAPKDNLELIRRCPYLKRLTWYSVVDDDLEHAAMEFVRLAKNRAWPNLESLGIRIGLGDDDMATVLENISFVTKLESDYSSFGLTSFTAMKRSFGMLRDLNVSNCPNMSSWMVQELLSSCPRLEVFMGDFLEAEDVLGGQPWGLEGVLHIQDWAVAHASNIRAPIPLNSTDIFECGTRAKGSTLITASGS
ncbi:hypothetical protein BGX21_005527 [Mortierella sp. AD011]|nr:hypothetical protein BGX21_005527 [Mortierella sp. AD011]